MHTTLTESLQDEARMVKYCNNKTIYELMSQYPLGGECTVTLMMNKVNEGDTTKQKELALRLNAPLNRLPRRIVLDGDDGKLLMRFAAYWAAYITCNDWRSSARYRAGTYQEVIRKDDTVKSFLDIDHDTLTLTDEQLGAIAGSFRQEYLSCHAVTPEQCKRPPHTFPVGTPTFDDHYVAYRNQSDARKVHMYFPGMIIKRVHLRILTQRVAEYARSMTGTDVVDCGANGLRMLYMTKPADPQSTYRPKHDMTYHNIMHSIVYFAVRTYRGETAPPCSIVIPSASMVSSIDPGSKEEILLYTYELMAEEHRAAFVPQFNNGLLALIRVGPSTCPICAREHHSEGAFMYITKGSVAYACHRDRNKAMLVAPDKKLAVMLAKANTSRLKIINSRELP